MTGYLGAEPARLGDGRTPARNNRFYEPIVRLPPVEAWPAADQVAWHRACLRTGPLDPPGGLAHLKPSSLDQKRTGWARFLTFLWCCGDLAEDEGPGDRVTPDRLGRFILSLRSRLSPRTAQCCVYTLAFAIEAMEPDRDWQWVRSHPGRPRNAEVQLGLKHVVPVDPAELLAGALEYCDAADRQERSVPHSIEFRDGLIVAFATYFATRRNNIFELKIGEHLIVGDDDMRLLLDETVKNGEIIYSVVPKSLEPYLHRYLVHHRGVLLGDNVDPGSVWISRFGQQLSYGSLFLLFQRTGERVIGRPINVHSVRYAMATATLDNDAHDIELASAGLAHRGTSSVARIYDKGGPQRANRAWRAILKRRRSRT